MATTPAKFFAVEVQPKDALKILANMGHISTRVKTDTGRAFRIFMADSERFAKEHATGGNPLYVQTDLLRSSITHQVEEGSGGWQGRLGSNVVYLAAHEFGARAHLVVPKDPDGFLSWVGADGTRIFAKQVMIPALPPRPVLQPGIKDAEPRFVENITKVYERLNHLW
jgi:hypothetical protein